MKKVFVLTLLLTTSLQAKAVIVQIDYMGTVDAVSGTGFGYSIGDAFAGTTLVDTSRVTHVSASSSPDFELADYLSTDANFVTGPIFGVNDALDVSSDIVQIRDGLPNTDIYAVQNYGLSTPLDGSITIRSERLQVIGLLVDFVSGVNIDQTFSLTSADLLSQGDDMSIFAQEFFANDSVRVLNELSVSLSSIRVGPQVAAVPEPSTLSLFGLGLVVIGVARRRMVNASC
jgi:hypothetical protein